MEKSPANPQPIAHNVYCGYWKGHHNIWGSRRIMCSPFIGTDNHTFSNPHQRTWSQLQARTVAEPEPLWQSVIGAAALAALFMALALI